MQVTCMDIGVSKWRFSHNIDCLMDINDYKSLVDWF
jgi:hypothetical protein